MRALSTFVSVLFATACASHGVHGPDVAGNPPTPVAVVAPPVTAPPATTPDPLLLRLPDALEFQQPAPDRTVIRLDTSKGNIVMEVFRDWAPRGAARFVNLVRFGYYDGNRFFRVTKGQWTQFGINGDPAVASTWRDETFPDDPFKESNVRGTVAFAFAVPNGRTTQVFINMRDNSATHDKEPFVPFGRIIEGMDVADALNAEYGEGPGGIRAGRQDAYFEGGNAYLARLFPNLDFIRHAVIVSR